MALIKKIGSGVKKAVKKTTASAKKVVQNYKETVRKVSGNITTAVKDTGKLILKSAGNTVKAVTGVNVFANTELSANPQQEKVVDLSYFAYLKSLVGISNVKYVNKPDSAGTFDKSLIDKIKLL